MVDAQGSEAFVAASQGEITILGQDAGALAETVGTNHIETFTTHIVFTVVGGDDIAHKIEPIRGVVLEEIVEQIGLAVSGAKVHVGYEYGSVVHCLTI